MTIPYIEIPCRNCDGTGGFQSDNGPSPRISTCEDCKGKGRVEYELTGWPEILDAIESHGATYQSLLDAFRAAGFDEAEARRELDDDVYLETLEAVGRPAGMKGAA